jgi:glycosyltransferase involved in cell wall biosynthesis
VRLGVDASNIRAGGGVTHLVELLRSADPLAYGFSQVIVWSGQATLDRIEDRPWLVKSSQPMLGRSLAYRAFWQRFSLSRVARMTECDMLFVPGGSYAGDFHPTATMSQNLLPFEWREMARYGLSWMTLKLLLLRWAQSASFRRANGVIFLTHYAQEAVTRVTGPLRGSVVIVPHGIDDRFARSPRTQRALDDCSVANPFRFLYVSIVDVYKHQWTVAEAVSSLRADGFPVALDLVGPAYGPALERLQRVLRRVDPDRAAIRSLGEVPYRELHRSYGVTDGCVFASSCENMPNILLEAMASGLPIACSDRGPMPEVLGDAGVYFDPEDVESIKQALQQLILSPALRAAKARVAFERAGGYSWRRCADETFGFLAEVAAAFRRGEPA